MQDAIRFIHRNGRVIPIRAPGGAGRAGKAAHAVRGAQSFKVVKRTAFAGGIYAATGKTKVKTNKSLDAAGLGFSLASGALAAATFSLGAKGLLAGAAGSHALDAVGVAANIASVKDSKGKKLAKAKQAARQEARNFVLGNAVFLAGMVGLKRNRQATKEFAGKVVQFAKKVIKR